MSADFAFAALALDASGTAKIAIDKLPPIDRAANLLVEMEYSDPNGEVLAVASRVPLHPAGALRRPQARRLGRRQKIGSRAGRSYWTPRANRCRAALSRVDVYERKTYSNRRRLVGGFYAYDSATETKRVGSGCSGTHRRARPHVLRGQAARASGEFILLRAQRTTAGAKRTPSASVWVRGR